MVDELSPSWFCEVVAHTVSVDGHVANLPSYQTYTDPGTDTQRDEDTGSCRFRANNPRGSSCPIPLRYLSASRGRHDQPV